MGYTLNYAVGNQPTCFKKKRVRSCILSHVDAQDKNDWRLRIKGKPAYLGLPGKWPLKGYVFDMA